MTASILAEEVTHADYWLSMEAKLGFCHAKSIIKSSKTVTPLVLGTVRVETHASDLVLFWLPCFDSATAKLSRYWWLIRGNTQRCLVEGVCL